MTEPQNLFGNDLFGEVIKPEISGRLREKFIMPPFSVLNAREGEWQERKSMWISLGIKSELGRGEGLLMEAEEVTAPGLNFSRDKEKANASAPGGSARPACDYSKKERGDGAGRPLAQSISIGNHMEKYGGSRGNAYGTSIFDPVLCELSYRWFCPPGGQIVDPFAGGSVRGVVAGFLGFKYHGIDLAGAQIAANEEQREKIIPNADVKWVVGDSSEEVLGAPQADFIYACPPYGDLERYSDDPKDLSTMDYPKFIEAYRKIIVACAGRLKNDRFACFVIGDFRDKKTGAYRGFIADTITIFRDAGMPLYNDAILITAVGSLPVRVSGQFEGSRKLGKTHQNVLVFTKGDGRKGFSK